MVDLDIIAPMSVEEEERLKVLTWEVELTNWVSQEESKERTSLIFLRQANDFKVLATDENIDDKADKNYAEKAIEYYNAYLEYTK